MERERIEPEWGRAAEVSFLQPQRKGLSVGGLALGVAGGILLAVAVLVLVTRLAARAEAPRVQQQLREQAEALQERQRQAELVRQQEVQAQAQARLARQEALRAAQAEAQRKAAAWAAFYKAPAHCAEVATVECANDYIRARKAFEARYRAGG